MTIIATSTEQAYNVSDADEIARIKAIIASYEAQLAALRATVPEYFWFDEMARIQTLIYAITDHATYPLSSSDAASLASLQARLEEAVYQYRLAREPVRDWYDITGDIVWSDTEFVQTARTGPGTFRITLKGSHPEFSGGEEIHFDVDGLRTFGGYVATVERGYFFADQASPKTTLIGTDYNIMLDRLALRNYPGEYATPVSTMMGGGPYRPWAPFPKGTMDSVIIKSVFHDYLLPDLPLAFDYETGVETIDTPAPVTNWVMPTAGSYVRPFLQSISMITGGVWYIDAYMRLCYHNRDVVDAPFPITDGLGGISSRGLTITADISSLKNDVIVWGTLANTVEGSVMVDLEPSTTVYAVDDPYGIAPPGDLFEPSITKWGFWQYAEFRKDIHHQDWLIRRAQAILDRYQKPLMKAQATIWDPGYQAGMVVNLVSSVHGIDMVTVIRQIRITFSVVKEPHDGRFYALPKYDLTMGLDLENPWNIYDYIPITGVTAGLGGDHA